MDMFSVRVRRRFFGSCSVAAGLILLAAGPSRADIIVDIAAANVQLDDNDGLCSLWEAIDSINQGHTAPFSGLHGCVHDQLGGTTIGLDGDNVHYRTFGASINTSLNIYQFSVGSSFIEDPGPVVLRVGAGTEVNIGELFTIQHTGTGKGRVIENHGKLTLSWVTIANGNVTGLSGAAGFGGGIYNAGDLVVHTSTVRNNRAVRGGGIYTVNANGFQLSMSTVNNNSTSSNGSTTGHGGGIYSEGSRVLAQHSTISNNTAAGQGGGIYITGVGPDPNAYCDMYWTTVASNTASSGGGVYVLSTGTNPVNTATENSIVASNQRPGGTLDDYRGNPHFPNPIMIHQRSLFRSTLGTTNTGLDLVANPLLQPLAFNHGGPTRTRALPANSPAVNAAPAGADCPDFDQTFNGRPVGPLCDLGSFEFR
jgi:hypothetical protein